MSRTSAAIQETGVQTLIESFGAVQMALADMPDSAFKTPSPMADAFLLADPALASLDKQMKEADGQYKKLVGLYGFDDAMVEAASLQRASIEQAYQMRLAALRRRRGEQGRGAANAANDDELKLQGNTRKAALDRLRIQREEEDRLLQKQQVEKKHNDALWLWVLLMWIGFRSAHYQQRPAFMPV